MKKIYFLLFVLPASLISFSQPLTGIKSIPGDYATITAAVADLNAQGVGSGGVTFNVAAGYTETLTAALVVTIATNPSSATRPVIFQRSGVGANPLITAYTGTTTNLDGIFIISGADFVTIDGIDLQENGANITTTQQMEWGYALLRIGTNNGSQYNTIKNCSITLNKVNTASIGIYSANHTTGATTSLTVNNFWGTNSYNRYYNNTVQNCFHGIDLNGYTGAAAPYDYFDKGNEIGTTGSGRNQVLNFGGGAAGTANGITCIAQNLVKIFNTNIDNSGGAATSTTLNGILTGTGNNTNIDIYNDTITLSSNATTSLLVGINNGLGNTGAGNTINIYNCVVKNCTYTTATSGEFRGIAQLATASYTNIHDNTISGNVLPGTGQWSGIYYGGNSNTLCLNVNINNNTINGNSKTGASGQFNCIYASANTVSTNCFANLLYNNSASSSAGIMYGYYNFNSGYNENVNSNQYYNNTSGTGTQIAFFVSTGSGPTNKTIYSNIVHDLTGAGLVGGILCDYATNTSIYKNNIYNLSSTGAALTPGVYGITCGNSGAGGVQNLYNNFISDLKTPSSTSSGAIYGLWLQGQTASGYNIFNNTIYLNASSSSATTFGTAGALLGTNPFSVDLRNNIIVNNSVPGPTGGNTVAMQRGNTTLTNYSLASGNNCLYAGSPAANRLIFYDGTNSDQTLQEFKNRVGYREQSSFSELPPFVNIAVAPYDLHLQTSSPTQCEKGGKPLASVSQDFDGDVRNGITPDVGADEIAGIMNDIASPDIQYTLLGNSDVSASRIVPAFATVTDPSGINTVAGTNPRLYYKKSTAANTFNDNTNATDGWKYVEASNATSPFSFTIDYSLLTGGGGVANGDIIQYFVIAQDLNATPGIGLNNGAFSTQPTSVNLAAANFPLNGTINQYTIVANAFTGVIPVGPAETITSLTNAGGIFSLINAGTLKGNVTISITGDLTAETGTNALNQWAETDGTGYTVSIVPSAGVTRTIAGSHATLSLIRMDGADRVTIDGRSGGTGNYLTFRNTSNAAPTIGFINDAQNNTVRNCIIESGNTSTSTTTGGAIFFGTTTGTLGNDNNTITNNEIRDRSDVAGTPAMGINCAGTTTTPAQANSGIIISDNNIHDWFLLNSGSQFAINVVNGNTNFSITGNSFYQTVTRANTVAGAITRAINISNAVAAATSGAHTISGNFIGGTLPGATGSDWTVTSTSTQTFSGILLTTGLLPCTVENNVVRKINFTANAVTVAATVFSGINATQGNVNIQGNTIGAATGTGAISITINAGGAVSNFLAGILAAGTNGTHNITGNTIGGWTIGGTTINGAIVSQYIQVQGTPQQDFSISNNLVGSTSTANSIQNTITGAACISFGIRLLITTGPSVTIANNIIQNVTDLSVVTSTVDYGMLLINTVGSNAPLTVNNNTISNFTGRALSTTPSINTVAISLQGYSGTGHLFSGNTISAISNTNAGLGQGYTVGIQVQGSATGGTMSKNKVFDINNANTGAAPGLSGLYFSVGDGWNVNNNMVSITNGAGTNALNVFGIAEYCAGAFNLFYNSVYVGGTGSGAINSYAYERGNSSRLNLKNNLLYNERTGGTGFHYAVGNSTATPSNGWTGSSSSYNTFITTSAASFGEWGTGVSQTMAQWKIASGGDNESYSETAANVPSPGLFNNTINGDLTINAANAESWFVNGKGIAGALSNSISADFEGSPRGTTEGAPTDIGADEFTPNGGVLPPDAVASAVPSPSTTTSYSFGGRKLGEIIWGASVPASISWKYYSGIPGPGATGLVINSYHDVPATGTAPYNFDIKLYYTLAEQNQIPDGELSGIKKNGTNPWTTTGGTGSSDADGKFVTSTGLTTFSLFSLKSTLNSLPLRLLSFTGKMNTDNTVSLIWEVADQSGIQKYLVERSGNGIGYNTIGMVTANTASSFTYKFTDGYPLIGKNYYRLRIVETDNRVEYSKTIVVNLRSQAGMIIYPQPATDHFTIQTGSAELVNTMMYLIDVKGKVAMSIRLTSQVQKVNIGFLPAGIYFLRTNDGESYKIIKL